MSKKYTTESYIETVKKIHGERYDYSKVIYRGALKEITILCRFCNREFNQKASSHLKHGCTYCGQHYFRTKDDLIREATEKFGDQFIYDKVEFKKLTDVITIGCKKCNKYFQKSVRDFLRTVHGCVNCNPARRVTSDMFIEIAQNIHGDKYEYSDCGYLSMSDDVKIFCFACNEYFIQRASAHTSQKQGCMNCSIKIRGISLKYTRETFIEKAKEVHGLKYDYDSVEYVNSSTPVEIYCNKCNKFFNQTPQVHLSNSGCRVCSFNQANEKQTKSVDIFIEELYSIFGDKYDYDYIKYINNYTKVTLKCNTCNKFFHKRPTTLLNGIGCICHTKRKHYSQEAIDWLDLLILMYGYIQHAVNDEEFVIPGTKYRADGYSIAYNIIFEYMGAYHHGCPLCFPDDRDLIRSNLQKSHNQLFEDTKKKIKTILSKNYKVIIKWSCGHNPSLD
jgi:hypothetical protein